MDYLDDIRSLEIALNTTNYLVNRLEKFHYSNPDFEISLNHAVLQTSSQFNESISSPEILVKHVYYIEDVSWAYTYIGPNTFKLFGTVLLDTLGEIVKAAFATEKSVMRNQINEQIPTRPLIWRLHFEIKSNKIPDNVMIAMAVIPKDKVYWLQNLLKDYREQT